MSMPLLMKRTSESAPVSMCSDAVNGQSSSYVVSNRPRLVTKEMQSFADAILVTYSSSCINSKLQLQTMSESGDSDPLSSVNVSSAKAMSSAESASSVLLLTDSENANNENRVIEMEANSSGGVEETPSASGETVQPSTVESVPGIEEKIDRSKGEEDSKQEDQKEQEKEKDADDDKEGDVEGKEGGSVEPGKGGQDQYAEHVTYNAAGDAIYTDPATKYQYRWCKEKSEWVPLASATEPDGSGGAPSENPFENEHYRWCHEKKEWIPKQKNPTETEFYRWDEATGKWIPKEQPASGKGDQDRDYGYEDGVHTYRDKDGAVYFWDTERKAWFPKVDDDFMAIYQLNYGFIDNTSGAGSASAPKATDAAPLSPQDASDDVSDEQEDEQKAPKGGKKRKAPPEPPKWFELAPEHNTKVYVSNLPTDITEEEFGEVMSKCGMVMKDAKTHKLKLKLYRDGNGQLKGDGLCHYIKEPCAVLRFILALASWCSICSLLDDLVVLPLAQLQLLYTLPPGAVLEEELPLLR
uniref:RRM domain-containing protein n=1 Tax=Anopheles atroparvus TaxID=41427 RepID=A0A182JIG6_ANOAO